MIAHLLLLSRNSFCHTVCGLGKKIIIIATKGVIPVQNFKGVILFSFL